MESDLNNNFQIKFSSLFTGCMPQKEFPGTGIGLALFKNIVANRHGELVGIYKENEGALFKILLPLSVIT